MGDSFSIVWAAEAQIDEGHLHDTLCFMCERFQLTSPCGPVRQYGALVGAFPSMCEVLAHCRKRLGSLAVFGDVHSMNVTNHRAMFGHCATGSFSFLSIKEHSVEDV